MSCDQFSTKMEILELIEDCSFRVGRPGEFPQTIYADSSVLIEKGTDFRRMFENKELNNLRKPIEVINIQPHIFRKLIGYLNLELPNLRGEEWNDLVVLQLAAQQYGIDTLEKLCIQRLELDLRVENEWEAFDTSMQCEEVRVMCARILVFGLAHKGVHGSSEFSDHEHVADAYPIPQSRPS
ncbi:Hypothetical predicted protein [Cloeon dipterum]|uniref:BTB domain-containing protein n=1 Tax=Cloeon dipterum TaxID=197152 RepID=A0A8S1CCD9_9INSE|nr:Hypothetical predicted protein [Cloeon dipterum]